MLIGDRNTGRKYINSTRVTLTFMYNVQFVSRVDCVILLYLQY